MPFVYRVQLAIGTLAAWLIIAAICWAVSYVNRMIRGNR